MSKGYVYILTNPSYPENWIKIGKTSKTVKERVDQLDCTSTPLPFNIYAYIKTEHFNELEKLIHNTIDNFSNARIRNNREFFNINPESVLNFIRDISDCYEDFEITVFDKDSDFSELDEKTNTNNTEYVEALKYLKTEYIAKFMNTDKADKWFSPLIYHDILVNFNRRDIIVDPITNEKCEIALDVVPEEGKSFIELFIRKKACGGINPNIDHLKLIDVFSDFDFVPTSDQKDLGKRRHSICIPLNGKSLDEIVEVMVDLCNFIEDNVDKIQTTILEQYE